VLLSRGYLANPAPAKRTVHGLGRKYPLVPVLNVALYAELAVMIRSPRVDFSVFEYGEAATGSREDCSGLAAQGNLVRSQLCYTRRQYLAVV